MRKLTTVLSVVLAVGLVVGAVSSWSRAQQAPARPPNIILVLSDDQDTASMAAMSKVKSLLTERGTTFANHFVTYSLCCPSRSSLLRGQYPHNTAVLGNRPPEGGFEKFLALGHEDSTVATWLRAGGYHTMFAGKYLNGYGNPGTDPAHVPSGWDEWYGALGNAPYQDFDYRLNENGRAVAYGRRPEDYLTDVIARKAAEAVGKAARAGQPLFAYLAPFTPHAPAVAAPRHEKLFQDTPLPRSPAFNEADVGDKPSAIRDRPPLNPRQVAAVTDLYRSRLRSLQAIDDLIEGLVRALTAAGQLENTYIVYTSDNGFHLGEHRLEQGKNLPYETDIKVPMVVRGPGVPAGRTVEAITLHNDLAPTFAELGRVPAPAFVDGRSLVPLLRGQSPAWRQSFEVVREGGRDGAGPELGDAADRSGPLSFKELRARDLAYVEWASGERELYDLKADPFELESLHAKADPRLIAALSARLRELEGCAAATCRALEDAPVGPR